MAKSALNLFELGGHLSKIENENWFGEHSTLGEYAFGELGFRKTKAYGLVIIYKTLLDLEIPWSVVEELGSTKVTLLCAKHNAGALNDDDFMEMLEDSKTMTCKELTAELKGILVPGSSGAPKVLTFKPHPDQMETIQAALVKAKDEGNTKVDTVALEYICLDHNSGKHVKPSGEYAPHKLKEMMGIAGPEKTAIAFKEQFPDSKLVISTNQE